MPKFNKKRSKSKSSIFS